MGKTLEVTLDRPSTSGHRPEQFFGLAPHRLHPTAPVSELLPGLLGILSLVNALKHQLHLVGDARYAPFLSHRIPLLGFLFRRDHPVLKPHPTCQLKRVPLSGVSPTLRFPKLVARPNHILDDVDLSYTTCALPQLPLTRLA